jgi:hypothetical protein
MNDFKKVLVACPTAAAKNYCFEEWLENVMGFTYPNFDIRMFDNTEDNGTNATYLNNTFKHYHGKNNDKFLAENILAKNKIKNNSVIERMTHSHNECRTYALKNDYDFLLHLESDVFPPKDVIERLMFHQKNVVGGLYFTDEGIYRLAMVMEHLELEPKRIESIITSFCGGEIRLFDGQIKEVAHIGLGCILISRKVMERIPFRFDRKRNYHPDTYFHEDLKMQKIPTHLDTSLVCRHENRAWGIRGIDFN